jgi:hypothetical protein
MSNEKEPFDFASKDSFLLFHQVILSASSTLFLRLIMEAHLTIALRHQGIHPLGLLSFVFCHPIQPHLKILIGIGFI